VVHVDRFGNLITNLRASDVAAARSICVSGEHARLARTYGDVAEGELCAYVGSAGLVEIGVRNGSAYVRTGAGRKTTVEVSP
jgi:S-adenosylmethionine hydrolase